MVGQKNRTGVSLFALWNLLAVAAPLAALGAHVERVTGRPFAAGSSGDFYSLPLDATPDGRYLLIYTGATNLVAAMADTNGLGDLLVYDRESASFDWITTHHLFPDRPAYGESLQGSISDDGRYVAFSSAGRQHAPGTTGQSINHVYLCDRQTHTTVKVSHAAGNPLGHGNGTSWRLLLSGDGRYLAYESDATNLVAGTDANNGTDVFQYDRTTGVNTLVSHATSGPANAAERRSTLAGMSADGRYLLLRTTANNLLVGFADQNGGANEDAFLWDRDSNSFVVVSHGVGTPLAGANQPVSYGLLAADGSRTAFASNASNLIAGFTDGSGGAAHAYVYERASGNLQLVSGVSATTSQNDESRPAALSADGRYLFFGSKASNVMPGLVRPADGDFGLFRFDTGTRAMALINHQAGQPAAIALGGSSTVQAAPDGEALLFVNSGSEMVAGQSGSGRQTFAYDMATGTARLVSHAAGDPLAGALAEPVALSADHRYAAFGSAAPNLTAGDRDDGLYDAFLYDLEGPTVQRLSSTTVSGQGSTTSIYRTLQSLPAAGLFLFHADDVAAFLPGVTDPDSGWDPVLYDPRTGALSALVAPGGATPGGTSLATFLPDGLNFLLYSTAVDLVPGMVDGNGAGADLYAGNRTGGGLQLISSNGTSPNTSGNQGLWLGLAYSANGRFVAYGSPASNAIAGGSDGNGAPDVILHDRQLGTRVLVSHAAGQANQAANARSNPVAMSADGELLLFESLATNLIPGFADGNGALSADLFLYRRSTGVTILVTHAAASTTQSGSFGSSFGRLSADGRFVFFNTSAQNLIPGMSDNNGERADVFSYETATGIISLASHAPGNPLAGANDEVQLIGSTPDGRYLLFTSLARNLVAGGTFSVTTYNTFRYDRVLDSCQLISHPPGQPTTSLGVNAHAVTLSDDGRYVAFHTPAPNAVAGQAVEGLAYTYNLFLDDLDTGERVLVSRSLTGPATTGNQNALQMALGPAARHAIFVSSSTNLALYEANPKDEIYHAELFTDLFRDGFEAGDTAAWSETVGGI